MKRLLIIIFFMLLTSKLSAEIIKKIEGLTQKKCPMKIKDRRPGDPGILVADPTKANQILNWKPQFSDLDNIIKTAYEWHKLDC